MGAVKAYTTYIIAREGLPEWHIVGLDKAIEAINLNGRDMPAEYRETAKEGLARCCYRRVSGKTGFARYRLLASCFR